MVLKSLILLLGIGLSPAAAFGADVVLPSKTAFPESLSSAPDGTLFVGSFVDGGILRIDPRTRAITPFVKPGDHETRSIFGVLVDPPAQMVWACSNDLSVLGVKGPSTVEGSFLKGFDLISGAEKVSARLPGSPALCNDIAVGRDHSVYVTNSLSTQILRLRPGASSLEVWLDDPVFTPPKGGAGLDGISFADDGNLYVNTFVKAELFRISVVDGKARNVTRLNVSRPLALTDGMRPLAGNTVLLVEGAGRLDLVTFKGDAAEVKTVKDDFVGPTAVTLSGDHAWVADGQVARAINPALGAPKLPFELYDVKLH